MRRDEPSTGRGDTADVPEAEAEAIEMNEKEYDFSYLPSYTKPRLMEELASLHEELANLHAVIAYNRVCEMRKIGDMATIKEQRIIDEGHRDALVEKKFLIVRLLDA